MNVFIKLLLYIQFVEIGQSFKCYKCMAEDGAVCSEPRHNACDVCEELEDIGCYIVKFVTGTTYRGCRSDYSYSERKETNDLYADCRIMMEAKDNLIAYCVTCDKDLCNAASFVKCHDYYVVLLIISIIVFHKL